ncbi:MAG: DUF1415 family protein [Caldimonas sp.]
MSDLAEQAMAQTRAWVEHAVIGLGLCPFATTVMARRQARFVVCTANDDEGVRRDLIAERQRSSTPTRPPWIRRS